MNYYLLLNNEQAGPFSLTQLMSMWTSGEITGETLHCFDGLTEWLPLGMFVEEEIAAEKAKAERKLARFEASSAKPAASGTWKPGEYLALVVMTVLVPFLGFAVGIINVWNPQKRQQAGQLLGLSVVMAAAGFFLLLR